MARRLTVSVVIAGLLAGLTAAVVAAQWPTTCVELNDIVEAHLGNHGNVGIYQRTFGDQAEAACQNDHRDDVRSVFAWAIGGTTVTAPAPAPQAAPQPTPAPAPVTTNWVPFSGSDSITGEKYAGVYVDGTGGATMYVRCTTATDGTKTADIFVVFGKYVYLSAYDYRVDVQWRWNDDATLNSGVWGVGQKRESVFAPHWQIPEFAYGLVYAGRLAFRAIEDSGDYEDAVFSLVGAGAPNHPVRDVLSQCGISV